MRRKRKIITGWRVFSLVVAALIAFSIYNARFVASAPLRGFYPDSTTLALSSWDFPTAWRSVQTGPEFKRMREDWPSPFAPLELEARLKTGIRPTPSRWRLWLGNRAVFAIAPEGEGVTAYPGLLLRWGDAIRTKLGARPDTDGISQYGNNYYAWHNGYLVASPSRAYVLAALNNTNALKLVSNDSVLFTVQWAGEHEGHIHVAKGAGFPVSGEVKFAVRDGDLPLTLPQAWPGKPVGTISARDTGDLSRIAALLHEAAADVESMAHGLEIVDTLANVWRIQSPRAGWNAGVDQVSIALFDMDTRAGVPIPSAAYTMRYADASPEANPFEGILDAAYSIPYVWDKNPGTMFPLVGMEFSPCIARSGREWTLATGEALMTELAGGMADGPACAPNVDIALRVSWSEFARVADEVTLWLGENELLPRRNIDDVRGGIAAKLKAIGALGTLQIDGEARGDSVKFSGHLASAAEDAET